MEEAVEENKDVKKKTDSRKFIVWLVWLLIVIVNLAIDLTIVLVTKKSMGTEIVSLTEKILGWFFAISMMYLGMNVTQKVGFAITDMLKGDAEK